MARRRRERSGGLAVEPRSFEELFPLLESGAPRVGVIGLGYIGLPLAVAFAEAGLEVLGFDIDAKKARALSTGTSYLSTMPAERIAEVVGAGRLHATDDFARINECDALLVCVPTPLNEASEPDMRFVEDTMQAIARHGRTGQLVVLESTTYPGTTEEFVRPILEQAAGRRLGKTLWIAFSPERLDPGNAEYDLVRIPKLVGGLDASSGKAATALYSRAFETVVPVSHARIAESAKLLENVYRAVNIAFVNELDEVFSKLGIDTWEVIRAASTKPFGYQPFYPGPGLGGHCLPIDPFYLAWKARVAGAPSRFIELAGEINSRTPKRILERALEALEERKVTAADAHVLVLGVAYKSGVSDTRESPGLVILNALVRSGARVSYFDPLVPELPQTRRSELSMTSEDLDAKSIATFDLVILVTAQPGMDLGMIAQHARAIIDTRNAFAAFPQAKIVRP